MAARRAARAPLTPQDDPFYEGPRVAENLSNYEMKVKYDYQMWKCYSHQGFVDDAQTIPGMVGLGGITTDMMPKILRNWARGETAIDWQDLRDFSGHEIAPGVIFTLGLIRAEEPYSSGKEIFIQESERQTSLTKDNIHRLDQSHTFTLRLVKPYSKKRNAHGQQIAIKASDKTLSAAQLHISHIVTYVMKYPERVLTEYSHEDAKELFKAFFTDPGSGQILICLLIVQLAAKKLFNHL